MWVVLFLLLPIPFGWCPVVSRPSFHNSFVGGTPSLPFGALFCILSFSQTMIPHTSNMKEYYLKNSRAMHADSLPRGKWWHPKGKKCCKSNEQRNEIEPAVMWSSPHRAPTHQKSRSSKCKKTDQNSKQLPLTAPLVFRVAVIVRWWTTAAPSAGGRLWRCQFGIFAAIFTTIPFLSVLQYLFFVVPLAAQLVASALLFHLLFLHTPFSAPPLPCFWPKAALPSLKLGLLCGGAFLLGQLSSLCPCNLDCVVLESPGSTPPLQLWHPRHSCYSWNLQASQTTMYNLDTF